jgi:hypothetical protein
MAYCRPSTVRYVRMFDLCHTHSSLHALLSADDVRMARSVVRSAGVRVASLEMFRRQCEAMSVRIYVGILILGSVLLALWLPRLTSETVDRAGVAQVAFVLLLVSLLYSLVLGREGGRWSVAAGVAGTAAAVGLMSYFRSGSADRFSVFLLGLLGPLVALTSTAVVALAGFAWLRIVKRRVDPRAILVIGLLEGVHYCVNDIAWSRTGAGLRSFAAMLEGLARIAERDIVVSGRRLGRDAVTGAWLKEKSGLVAARIRDAKKPLLLPNSDFVAGMEKRVTPMFVAACRGDWEELGSQASIPAAKSRFSLLWPKLMTATTLATSAFVLPSLLPDTAKAEAASSLRVALLLGAMLAFMPSSAGPTSLVPEVFKDFAKP